ncbi:hypothetical protein EW053_25025 [Streptomyces sp. IB2014 016-6]|nr:hypothetical protein EW053_25025 [Streptomyces sp. IB2014 016-6]
MNNRRRKKLSQRLVRAARLRGAGEVAALLRQPKDLEELWSISNGKRGRLHSEANRRDLSGPAARCAVPAGRRRDPQRHQCL